MHPEEPDAGEGLDLEAYLASEEDPDDSSSELNFRDLAAFVEEYLAAILRRRVDGRALTWCARWWEHPEAIARLAALWRAFEYLSVDPALGMSTWWLHHADPHLAVLLDPERGPFAGCAPDGTHHVAHPGLVLEPVPEGLLDYAAFSLDVAEGEALTAEEVRQSEKPWLGWIALAQPEPPPSS